LYRLYSIRRSYIESLKLAHMAKSPGDAKQATGVLSRTNVPLVRFGN
jgi:hypothetical protein